MKAAIINRFGPPEVIEIVDVQRPILQEDEILVRVHAAAINPKDTFIRKGYLKYFTGSRFPMMMGFDFSGQVTEIGPKVNSVREGDKVYGMLSGWHGRTCAEYVAVKDHQLAAKPSSLSFEQAAALPLAASTALQALRDEANIQENHKVCINGASGGVGSMAIQIANIYNTSVTAISRTQSHDFLRDLGADNVIDYQEADVTQSKQKFDIFFDVFGNQPFKFIKPILTSKGVWVSTVLKPHVYLSVVKTRFFSRKKAKLVIVKSDRSDLSQIAVWVDDGQIKPIIHEVFPFEKIREAHIQQETKHTRGKIIVQI
jgi:NADPH:quinone reductase-like Zn-dependent oxidoreductase